MSEFYVRIKRGKKRLREVDTSTFHTRTLKKTNLAVEVFHFPYGTEYSNNEVGLRQRQPVNVYKYFESKFSVIICLILLDF